MVPQLQKDGAPASPINRSSSDAGEETRPGALSRHALQDTAEEALQEAAALRQQLLEMNQENEELLDAKLQEAEARAAAERSVRDLQEKLGRATAKNAAMAEGMVRKELELREEIDEARATVSQWMQEAGQAQAELTGVQGRYVTASRRAAEIASAAPRPLPPPLDRASRTGSGDTSSPRSDRCGSPSPRGSPLGQFPIEES